MTDVRRARLECEHGRYEPHGQIDADEGGDIFACDGGEMIELRREKEGGRYFSTSLDVPVPEDRSGEGWSRAAMYLERLQPDRERFVSEWREVTDE